MTNSRYLCTLALAATAVLAITPLTGCHSTSIKSTWKSPDYQGGPVAKIALLAVAEEGLVRGGFENRLARELGKTGQDTVTTYKTLALPEIKADKEAAAARLRQAGADSILILRVVDSTTQFAEVRQTGGAFVPVAAGASPDSGYGWYSLAFTDMSVVRGSTRQDVVIRSSLFDLKTGKELWTCVTDSVVKDDVDRLKLADAFVARVVAALRQEGLVR